VVPYTWEIFLKFELGIDSNVAMPHELKVTLWPLKFWRLFSTLCRGREARGLSQHDNAEILSCYELFSCKESSKCSVAMLTYGEFCCNQSCCDAGSHLGVTLRDRGDDHVTERSANFEFISPCWDQYRIFFERQQLAATTPSYYVWIVQTFVAILLLFKLSISSSFQLQSCTKRWVNIVFLSMEN